MLRPENVKILVVDDLPEKLLAYQAILADPSIDLILAQSGTEALKHVLQHDFAVILLDVNMPGMDGFEMASLIRARKRSAHTPIIFITAFMDEVNAIAAYTYGAVDYILAPVVPEVLRTKVRVFVELFRLSEQVKQHAARAVASAEREQARLTAVLETAPDFVGVVDAHGRMLSINRAGRRMLGFGSRDPLPTNLADCAPASVSAEWPRQALATAAEKGVWFGETVLANRADQYIPVSQVILAHKDDRGGVESFSIIARDISEQKHADLLIVESARRYRQLVQCLPVAVYTCDAHGRILLYNDAAATLWGRKPEVGKDLWCGSWRIYHPDGTPLPLEECPMAVTLRERRAVRGQEIMVERPDGTRRSVLPHPEPIIDGSGTLVGAVNMLMDITESKRADETRSLLATIVDSTDNAVLSKTLDGVITSCNKAAGRLFGYTPDELIGQHVTLLIPSERVDEEQVILDRIRRGEHIEHFETVRLAKDGRRVEVSLSISPMRDAQGRIVGASKIARDITAHKAAEAELLRHRAHLEELVHERTAELEESHERLRLTDRLASIGTLAAGLGHDMGNLLLPLRMRLESLESLDLPEQARNDIRAVNDVTEYLKRLCQGLRLFALDPTEPGKGEYTALSLWWLDVEPFLRNTLPRHVVLESDFFPGVLPIAMPPHTFTQVIYNLVQNAGESLRDRDSGRVRISASMNEDGRSMTVSVADDGPGMTDDVQMRCMEPFFTTKTRRISTGLGLALVRGAVCNAGGSISIESQVGAGSTFHLVLPVHEIESRRAASETHRRVTNACVTLRDARLRAYMTSLLTTLDIDVRQEPWSARTGAQLLILDSWNGHWKELQKYLGEDASRRVVVLGGKKPRVDSRQIVWLGEKPSPARVRDVLRDVIGAASGQAVEVDA